MGFDSDDGEKDEDFNSQDGSQSAKEDSFDSDFSDCKNAKKRKKSAEGRK